MSAIDSGQGGPIDCARCPVFRQCPLDRAVPALILGARIRFVGAALGAPKRVQGRALGTIPAGPGLFTATLREISVRN